MIFNENPNHGHLFDDHELSIDGKCIIVNLNNYTDLGWQKDRFNNNIIARIHNDSLPVREFDNSLYKNRATDIVYICDTLKVYWHIDMSD